ncbi:MAG: hypothetical protein B7X32_19705 [Microbacterium sp. 13-71-7]|nr:MAG: hypothetical protein B7X32_19705 [Microbacterium sp. 13-71-7]
MSEPRVRVTSRGEPSDAAWRRFGDVAARVLFNLAERDLEAAAAAIADDTVQDTVQTPEGLAPDAVSAPPFPAEFRGCGK